MSFDGYAPLVFMSAKRIIPFCPVAIPIDWSREGNAVLDRSVGGNAPWESSNL